MARFNAEHQAELDGIKKKEDSLRKQLSALSNRSGLLFYAQLYKVDPDTQLARMRKPLLEMKVKYDKAVALLLTLGFKLDKKGYGGFRAPDFSDESVFRIYDFFGAQCYSKRINGTKVQVTFDVPMGNSKILDEDYLCAYTHIDTPKSKPALWHKANDAGIKSGDNAYFLKTFKAFENRINKLISVIEAN